MSADKCDKDVYISPDGTILRGDDAMMARIEADVHSLRSELPPPTYSVTLQHPNSVVDPDSESQNDCSQSQAVTVKSQIGEVDGSPTSSPKANDIVKDSPKSDHPTAQDNNSKVAPHDEKDRSEHSLTATIVGQVHSDITSEDHVDAMPDSDSDNASVGEHEPPVIASDVSDSSSEEDQSTADSTETSSVAELVNSSIASNPTEGNVVATSDNQTGVTSQSSSGDMQPSKVNVVKKLATAGVVATKLDSKVSKRNIKCKDIKAAATALAASTGVDVKVNNADLVGAKLEGSAGIKTQITAAEVKMWNTDLSGIKVN